MSLRPVAEFSTPPLDGVVEVLELMLEEAKAGRLLGLIAVGCNPEGCTASVVLIGPHTSVTAMLGELEATKARFMREHIEGCE